MHPVGWIGWVILVKANRQLVQLTVNTFGHQFMGQLKGIKSIAIDITFGAAKSWPQVTLNGINDDNIWRQDGVDYHNLDLLELRTGSIPDIVNVRGTSGVWWNKCNSLDQAIYIDAFVDFFALSAKTMTTLVLNGGDDQVFVSSDAAVQNVSAGGVLQQVRTGD